VATGHMSEGSLLGFIWRRRTYLSRVVNQSFVFYYLFSMSATG